MIVVFDAQCLLCNRWVQFLLRHDRKAVLRFASIQGVQGQRLLAGQGLKLEGLDTLLAVEGGRVWQHSGALIRVLGRLGGVWRLAWLAWLIPSGLRDPAYRWMARRRYRLFGRSETCLVPPPDHADRFLD